MSIELTLITIVVVAFLFSFLSRRLHLSDEIGLVAAGLIFGTPIFQKFFITGNEPMIDGLSNLGLITLMFLAGFEISGNMLFKQEKNVLAVTFSTMLSSLFIGTIVFRLLGFEWQAALLVGACFGITAEATKARALLQLKKLKTKLGTILMGTGIINDIIGILILLLLTYVFKTEVNFDELYILALIVLAFAFGMFVHYRFDRFSRQVKTLERALLVLIVPFFFVNLGIHFDLMALQLDWKILLIVVLTAIISQIVGVFLTKPITRLRNKQLFLLGWGMNSKGAVELAIAYIGLQVGLLPVNLYSALVISSLTSTIIFQLIIFNMVRHNPRVMK